MVNRLIYTQHTKSLVHHCIINPKPVHCQQLFELLAYSRHVLILAASGGL